MTVRRRAMLALLVFLPVAWLYVYVASSVVRSIARQYRYGYALCDDTFRRYLNYCGGGYSLVIGWLELVFTTALLLVLLAVAGRWVAQPLRTLAGVVNGFGPTSTGVRIGSIGPARDETHLLGAAIDALLDRMQTGYEAQRRFASNASHELRTPLATQRALIEISLTSALTPDQLDLLSRQLLATNERNERLVDGLLTLAETDRGVLSADDVALDRLAADAIAAHAADAAARGVTVRSDLQPTSVRGETALLERLVANLLQNAVKYNHQGGTVDVRVADGTLVVSNTGDEVPGDQVGLLFEPFRRLSGERLDHGGGVGLGLTIVRSIVLAHSGRLDAAPNPGGGLTVAVHL